MEIRKNINFYKEETGRYHARLIAVSKTHSIEKITEAYEAGQRIFGENKVQEMEGKYESLPKDIQWHMIGHLQTNKVKFIAPFVSLIHSVDSEKLLAEIDKQGGKAQRIIPCLLQVHIAEEENKFGFDDAELLDMAQKLTAYKHVTIQGLMGMATFTENQEQLRREFKHLKDLFEKVKAMNLPGIELKELSMGMSADYKIALEEGSTMVRIGSALFGGRPSHAVV
jgi:pyridoxal phosphate enzyme (YggS family)